MAATSTFGSLSIPAPDDTMEMSSPANRPLDDDDIDIDFDDYPGGVQVNDDENMQEDGDATRPNTATDEVMDDDAAVAEQPVVQEEVMGDDAAATEDLQQEDEDLIDYSEEDLHEQPVEDASAPDVVDEPTDIVDAVTDQVDENVAHTAEDVFAEEHPSEQLIDPTAGNETTHVPRESAEDPIAGITDPGQHHLEMEEEAGREFREEEAPLEEDARPPPIDVNTNHKESGETPGTPTDTGLHHMTVRYAHLQLPLFKSRRQPDGLLKDDNLASLSLAELVRNCRSQLGSKLGESISEDQEMILGFEHMGLMLVEDCRAAFESSLNDVLEVYLQLHHNDHQIHDIPPLSLSLTPQLKFTSSFNLLKQAAAGGQGMSTFGFLQPAAEEEAGNYYHDQQEEYAEEGHQEEADQYGYADEANQPEFHDEEQSGENQHEDAAQEEYYEQTGEGQAEEHNEDTHYDESAEDQYHADDPGEATAALEDFQHAGDSAPTDAVYSTPGAPEATTAVDIVGEELEDGSAADAIIPGTDAATIQGDLTNEYDITTSKTEEHDGFETLLTEYGEGDIAQPVNGQNAIDPTTATEEHLDLGSEDFLNEFTTTGQEEGYVEGHEHYDLEDGDFDANAEDYHPDYAAQAEAEGDEEFHTTHEFLDYTEHDAGVTNGEGQGEEEEFNDSTVIIHPQPEDEDEVYIEDDSFNEEPDDSSFLNDDSADISTPAPKAKSSKRSFDEVNEADVFDDGEGIDFGSPEVKKARAS